MQLLELVGMLGGEGGLIANIAGSAVGGGVLMTIVSMIKSAMAGQKEPA